MILFRLLLKYTKNKIDLLKFAQFAGGKYNVFCNNKSTKIGHKEVIYHNEKFKLYYDCGENNDALFYLHSLYQACFLVNYIDDTKELFISNIQNHDGCKKLFPNHSDTISFVLKFMIRLAKDLGVKTIIFEDTSGKGNFDLADNYFILHGKTWYDKKLSELLKCYNIEFYNKNIPYAITYNEVKNRHIKTNFTRFEEITPEYKKEYFDKIGIKGLTGIGYIITNITYF